jgi:transposase
LYAAVGRPSIPPERLLRALLLQVFYSIRSERLLMEQLDYNRSFQKKDSGNDDPNAGRDFHGEQRSNQTHQSKTDPDAGLYEKSSGYPLDSADPNI